MGMIYIDNFRTGRGLNDRLHWRAKAKRVRAERQMVAAYVNGQPRPEVPLVVTLTRIAPSNGLDDDGLCGALKGVRDQVAAWLGVDDRHRHIVQYTYHQERGPWAVRIEWRPMDV